MNTTTLRSLEIPLPPLDMQRAFARKLNQFQATKVARRSSRHQLDLLFRVLLHRAFSGILTARWRQAHMKELLQEMEAQARALQAAEPEPIIRPVRSRSAKRKGS